MGWYQWRPYVPVARRREAARRNLAQLKQQGKAVSPVIIDGRIIAKSFWGKSWCENLESYSDYDNRLPRGRSYVRNGSVVDLQINRGEATAMVCGSEMYTIKVNIAPVAKDRWLSICGDCAGSIGSVVELLQGKLSKNVMERVCRRGDGLFPAPAEIRLSCSCPDWAGMCKHVAAAMYGIGARLDERPELLFTLRAVNERELIAEAGNKLPLLNAAPASTRVLAGDDLGALFGIDVEEEVGAGKKAPPPEGLRALPPSKKGPPKARKTSSDSAKAIKRIPRKAKVTKTRGVKKIAGKAAKAIIMRRRKHKRRKSIVADVKEKRLNQAIYRQMQKNKIG